MNTIALPTTSQAAPRRLFWPLQIGGWCAYFVLNFLVAMGDGRPLSYVLVSLSVALCGFATTSVLRLGYRRLWGKPPRVMVPAAALMLVLATIVQMKLHVMITFRHCEDCEIHSLFGYLWYFASALYLLLALPGNPVEANPVRTPDEALMTELRSWVSTQKAAAQGVEALPLDRRVQVARDLALAMGERRFVAEGEAGERKLIHGHARQSRCAIRIVVAVDPDDIAPTGKAEDHFAEDRWHQGRADAVVEIVAEADDGRRLVAIDDTLQQTKRRKRVIGRQKLAAHGEG